MEREITELRNQVATLTQQAHPAAAPPSIQTSNESLTLPSLNMSPLGNSDPDSGAAVASLMDLATGGEAGSFMRSPSAILLFSRRLGDVTIGQDQIQSLFQMYATFIWQTKHVLIITQLLYLLSSIRTTARSSEVAN